MAIKPSDVQAVVKKLAGSHAPGTVRNIYDVLARVLTSAVDDRMLAHTPCRRIMLPSDDAREVAPPTVEQVSALAAAMPGRFRATVVLLAGSGLRIGELLGLRVADVDFLRRAVRVDRQRLQDGTIGPTKTGKSARTVPLGGVVIDELARHLAEHPSGEWLFTVEDGRPLTYRRWKGLWKVASARAGVPVATHALRHFFASALIAGGASVKQVQTVLGHASPVITLRVYAHLWPGEDDRTRSVIDDTLGVLRTNCGPGDSRSDDAAGQSG